MAFQILDGLKNLVANLGTSRDKAAATAYSQPLLTYEQLTAAYRSSWLSKKIVNVPAMDATRSWRDWQAEAEQISAIEAEENRLNLRLRLRQAMKAARLYGGAAIYIGTDDTDLKEPLDLDRIGQGGIKYLTMLTPRTLSGAEVDYDPASEWFNKPKYWRMSIGNVGNEDIHPSRLVILTGEDYPPDDPIAVTGWGDSVLAATIDAIKASDATMANVASMVFEAKIDIIRVPEMMERLSEPQFERKLLERFGLAGTMKGINGMLVIDKEEEYEQKSLTFANIPEIMDRFFQAVSGAADIPMTRLVGMSPGGLNASGDSDLRNYYDHVKAMQEMELQPAMYRLDEGIIRSALGDRPPEIHYKWTSLWQISEKDRSEIGLNTATTVKTLWDTGIYLPETLEKVATNALVEDGVFPGMESAVEEGMALPRPNEPEDTEL